MWGILNHSDESYKSCNRKFTKENICTLKQSYNKCPGFEKTFSLDFYNKYKNEIEEDAWTVEALIVRQADEIAQRHHDVEDALETNIIEKEELVNKIEEYFGFWLQKEQWSDDFKKIKEEDDKTYYMPMLSSLIVDFLTTKYIENLETTLDFLINEYDIQDSSDFHKNKPIIKKDYKMKNKSLFEEFSYEESLRCKEKDFQRYLKNRILNSFLAQAMDGKSNFIIRQLIKAYITNPQQLPDKTIFTLYRNYLSSNEWNKYKGKSFIEVVGRLRNQLNDDYFTSSEKGFKMVLLRIICDYIAGMTDNYAIEQYNLLYGSKRIGHI